MDPADRPFSSSYVVELVGPAGAGKSSLVQAMTGTNRRVVASTPPDFHALNTIPFFAFNTLQTAPHLLRFVLTKKPAPDYTSQMASIVILNGWHRNLTKSQPATGEVLLLDQGPVYLLTDLFELNPGYSQCGPTQKWQMDIYQRWAHMIDLVVWLDAPDPVLTERIRSREKQHIVKHQSEDEICQFLALCRDSLDRTLMKLSYINRSLKIIEFDTSTVSPFLITSKVFSCLGLIEDLI